MGVEVYKWKMWNYYVIYVNYVHKNVPYDVHYLVNIAKVNHKEICMYCVIIFFEKQLYIGHLITHTEEKTCKCFLCDANIMAKSELKYKKGIHTGEKLCQCCVCGTSTYIKSDYISYLRIHSRGLSVLFCNGSKSLDAKLSLKTYYKTHTGEKPYQCNICDTCFVDRTDLGTHTRIHTGGKPYKCSNCEICLTDINLLMLCNIYTTLEKHFQCSVRSFYSYLLVGLSLDIDFLMVIGKFIAIKGIYTTKKQSYGMYEIEKMYNFRAY